jgi:hypothetical protein
LGGQDLGGRHLGGRQIAPVPFIKHVTCSVIALRAFYAVFRTEKKIKMRRDLWCKQIAELFVFFQVLCNDKLNSAKKLQRHSPKKQICEWKIKHQRQ